MENPEKLNPTSISLEIKKPLNRVKKRLTNDDIDKAIKSKRDNILEVYSECPLCGHEPSAIISPASFVCPKCHGISLFIGKRIKQECLGSLDTSDGCRVSRVSTVRINRRYDGYIRREELEEERTIEAMQRADVRTIKMKLSKNRKLKGKDANAGTIPTSR